VVVSRPLEVEQAAGRGVRHDGLGGLADLEVRARSGRPARGGCPRRALQQVHVAQRRAQVAVVHVVPAHITPVIPEGEAEASRYLQVPKFTKSKLKITMIMYSEESLVIICNQKRPPSEVQ
jgi:hypothetical protein